MPWCWVRRRSDCAASGAASQAGSCEDLRGAETGRHRDQKRRAVAAGAFVGPGNVSAAGPARFCRVVASVKAAADSDIAVEIWLPERRLERVFHGNGSGGFGGIARGRLCRHGGGMRRGYATAITDTGTAPATSLNGDPLIGHPQQVERLGVLSTHVMTVTGKAIAKAFYGQASSRSYYTGCSTGGQQGLIEAQYYPGDYDGILVGAPVINRTWGHAVALWDGLAANLAPGHKLSDISLPC